MEPLWGFLLAGFALTGSPGPATLSLAGAAAAFGLRASLGYLAGILAGLVVVMAAAASGAIGLAAALPGLLPAVTVAAALYFLYLAFRIATAPAWSAPDPARQPPRFLAGLLLSLVNPKGYVAMAALFSGFAVVRERPVLDAALKAAILLPIILAVDLAWLAAGAQLTRHLRSPRASRGVNVAFALLLVASIGFALLF